MGKVFVPQISQVRDPETGMFRPRFDITPAKQWGEVIELLGGSANPLRDKEDILDALDAALYDYSDADYILCTGSPILIGWTAAIAANYNYGRVKMLQWSNVFSKYESIDAVLWRNE